MPERGPAVADKTIRHSETKEERTVPEAALPFFVNQGFVVLDSAGRVSGPATTAAADKKEK